MQAAPWLPEVDWLSAAILASPDSAAEAEARPPVRTAAKTIPRAFRVRRPIPFLWQLCPVGLRAPCHTNVRRNLACGRGCSSNVPSTSHAPGRRPYLISDLRGAVVTSVGRCRSSSTRTGINDPDCASASLGGTSISVRLADTPRAIGISSVADQVQEWAIEELWIRSATNWPPCPHHSDTHPLAG